MREECVAMYRSRLLQRVLLCGLIICGTVFADETFDRLYAQKKYQEAVDYAENAIEPQARSPELWVKIGDAFDHIDMPEKALACYLVSWRMNPQDYQSLVGAAKAYNRLTNPEMGLEMAQKALTINYSADAAWEFAKACIALNRPAEAKKAMAKVIEGDSSNTVAVTQLSTIYFNEGDWASAVPLLKLTYKKNATPRLAFQIGQAYSELGVADSAVLYLLKARDGAVEPVLTSRYLGRAYFIRSSWGECIAAYGTIIDSALTADDLYRYAVATEKSRGAEDAAVFYEKAVTRFGTSIQREALLAREGLARIRIKDALFTDAIPLLREVVAADPKGLAVPRGSLLLAEAYQGTGDFKNAVATLEGVIAVNSRNVEAYAQLADCYQKNGKPEKAQEVYTVLTGLAPDDPGIYRTLGNFHLSNLRYKEALEQFEKSCRLKKSAAGYEGIAAAAYGLNQKDRAAAAADSALALDAKNRKAALVKAHVLLDKKQYDAACRQFEKLLEKEPDNGEILYALTACYGAMGAGEKLVAVDKKVSRLNPADTASRIRLAAYYTKKDSVDAAIGCLRELQALLPASAGTAKELFRLSRLKRDLPAATVWLRTYLSLKPDDAEAQRDMGNILYEQNDTDEALEYYRTALKLNPAVGGFYKRYAELVMARGEQAEVIAALTGVIKAGGADPGTYLTLGLIYQKKKEYIDAIEMYQAALKREPANFEALAALASCQAANGTIRDAIVSYEQAIMMNSGAVSEYRDLGSLYLQEQREDEAMKMYIKYLSRDSSDAGIAQKVGHYVYTNGRLEDAVRYYGFAGKKLDAASSVEYAAACCEIGRNRQAISMLLPLKADRMIRGETEQKVLKLLAQAYENDSDYTSASAAYGEYLGLRGVDDREAAFKQASLLNINDPVAAQRVYELNCRKYPSDFRNFLNLALIYSGRKDMLTKAIPLLKRVTELADSMPEVWLELGKIYEKTGDEKEELSAYRKYIGFYPQSVEANRRVGMLLMRRGDYNEGTVFLEIANTQQSHDPEIMTLLAGGYVKSGRFNEAVALLDEAKAQKKDDPNIRFELFELYQKNGQKEKARKEIEELVKLSREPQYLQLYADAMIIQGKNKEAEATIEELMELDPENRNTLYLKGKLLRAEKLYDDAIEIYKELNQIDPTDGMALFERAEAHREQGKPQWAETFYKRALRADPRIARAELGLALLAKARKDSSQYQECLIRARELAPDDELINAELQKISR